MNGENPAGIILDSLLFPRILQSFRMAIQPSKLIIAFWMIATTGLVGWVMDLPKTVVTTPGTNGIETELTLFLNSPERSIRILKNTQNRTSQRGVFDDVGFWNSEIPPLAAGDFRI